MISLLLMKKIAELFLIMFAAFLVVKTGVVEAKGSLVLSRLCVYLVYPCMYFNAFQIALSREVLHSFLLSALFALGLNIFLLLVGQLLKKTAHASPVEIASVQYPNAGNLLIPVVLSVFGSERRPYNSVFIAVQAFFVWTHGVHIFHPEEKFDPRRLLLNINLIAVMVGLLFFLTGWKLPSLAADAVSSLAAMAGPCGMIVTGMLIASTNLKTVLANKRIYLVTAVRMLLCPAAVLLLLKLLRLESLLPDGRLVFLISFLPACAPTAATVTQLAQIYRQDSVYASAINIFTTLLCILTMPFFVWMYELF